MAHWFLRRYLNFVNIFLQFLLLAWPYIWTKLNPLHPRMLCAKFGWNWPSGSGEDENVNSLQMDRRTDNRRIKKLTWAFSSDELIKFNKNWLAPSFFPPPPTQKESVKLKIQFLSTSQKVFNLCILYHLASILVLKVLSLFYGTSQNYSIISFTFNKWPFSLFMSVQQKAKWSFSAGGQ